ncbi:hypothetical protein EDC94DRAFT_597376 [Helicostylum pulchrum]|uniref:C3H1-type domain-containing protein n=1 Tax=Helicostylum pulchrum TaxID=562976 RepID=A0ABP9Y140_9FUNG|nr:hypothetical protein EDC94DRAFT_597376 [Helicostylum pulchrum]
MATDQEMLDRIAKLSSAINQQKSMQGGYIPTYNTLPAYPARPYNARGRGGNMSVVRPNVNNVRPYARPISSPQSYAPYTRSKPYGRPVPYIRPQTPPVSHNRKFVLNTTTPSSTVPPTQKSHHRKLVINHKGTSTTNNTMVKSVDAATGRKQVAINGIDFVVKGKKLIRKDLFDSNTTKSNFMGPKVLVRRTLKRRDTNQNMVLGQAPGGVKRKGGNMVFTRGPEGYVRQGRSGKSLVLSTQAKKPRYCGFFTRYGKCPNANRCTFQHDVNRRAICPRFLQNKCQKICKLSHTPNEFNMPHCVHFQKGSCKNDPCMYMHVRTSTDAPVCKAFAMEGYCSKGTECVEKHVHVCPEFAETGQCSNANCRLPHVAKRTASTAKASGIIRLGSWVSPQYFHAQKMAKLEKKKAIEDAAAAKVWTRPQPQPMEQDEEKQEEDGFVRLFDDSDDDDGWSQFERESDSDIKTLRFGDDEEEEEEEEGGDESEEEEDNSEEDGSDVEEVYEEVSDGELSDIEEPPLPPT